MAPSSWDFSEQASAPTPFPTQVEYCTSYHEPWTCFSRILSFLLDIALYAGSPLEKLPYANISEGYISNQVSTVNGLKSNQSHGVIPGSAQYDVQYTQVQFIYYPYSGYLGWWL